MADLKSGLSIWLLFSHSMAAFFCLLTTTLLFITNSNTNNDNDNDKYVSSTNPYPPSSSSSSSTKSRKTESWKGRTKFLFLNLMLLSGMIYFVLSMVLFIGSFRGPDNNNMPVVLLTQQIEIMAMLFLYLTLAYIVEVLIKLNHVSGSQRLVHFLQTYLGRRNMLIILVLIILTAEIPILLNPSLLLLNIIIRLIISLALTPLLLCLIHLIGRQIWNASALRSRETLHALYRLAFIIATCLVVLVFNFRSVLRRLVSGRWRDGMDPAKIIDAQLDCAEKLDFRHFYGIVVTLICVILLVGERAKFNMRRLAKKGNGASNGVVAV